MINVDNGLVPLNVKMVNGNIKMVIYEQFYGCDPQAYQSYKELKTVISIVPHFLIMQNNFFIRSKRVILFKS